MTKVGKAGQRETKETQRNGKSIKIALKRPRKHSGHSKTLARSLKTISMQDRVSAIVREGDSHLPHASLPVLHFNG
jgi:hypothetical protein